MSIQSPGDLKGMRHVGRIVAFTIQEMRASVRIGMTTAELDAVAASVFARTGASSAPKRAYGFPGMTCISVNDEIVHGVPGPRRIQPGDVVKIDVTAESNGYIADAATTILLPPINPTTVRLKEAALNGLNAALNAAKSHQRVSVIGRAIEREAARSGFSIVRELCGHGVGRKIHEPPQVANYEDPFCRDILTDGLVIAIEPMLTERPSRATGAGDGWTMRTNSGVLAVHEEHTVVITRGVPLTLTVAA